MNKKILILGITGQDGSYMAEEQVAMRNEVHGIVRRSSVDNTCRLNKIKPFITLHHGDLSDAQSITNVIHQVQPDEIYNLADQDDVAVSHATPGCSADVTAGAVYRLLEAVHVHCPDAKVFQAISATIFGDTVPPQGETARLNPLSPYACCKVSAYYACRYYRQVRGLQVWTGILFNHDSPRRKPGYLLGTICRKAKAVAFGGKNCLELGCLDERVDIGYALEYVQAMYGMLSRTDPDDYVIGTGHGYTVRNMAETACKTLGIPVSCVKENPEFKRFGPSMNLVADPAKIRAVGLRPVTTSLALILHYLRNEPCE